MITDYCVLLSEKRSKFLRLPSVIYLNTFNEICEFISKIDETTFIHTGTYVTHSARKVPTYSYEACCFNYVLLLWPPEVASTTCLSGILFCVLLPTYFRILKFKYEQSNRLNVVYTGRSRIISYFYMFPVIV